MFDFFNQMSQALSGPIHGIAYGFEHIPLLFAFFLGLVGAVAPCQLTSNVSAITIYGNKTIKEQIPWLHICLFILGKLVVFSLLGMLIWMLGNEVKNTLVPFFPMIRKAIGPILIVIGLFIVGVFQFNKSFGRIKFPKKLTDSYVGSFLMGVSFTLAFCPTMFILFFMTLMPIVWTTSYGVFLPAVFGIGTSIPLLLVIFLIWYVGASGVILKKSRKIGVITQKIAGGLLIGIGLFDTLTYWL